MSFVWTMAEQHAGRLKTVSFELLARGRALADALDTRLASVVLGAGLDDAVLEELVQRGADEVYYVEDDRLAEFECERHAAVLTRLIKQYAPSIVLAAATTTGRTLMPYVAIKVNAGLTADCTELAIESGTGNLLQTRPAIGGNIMATIKTPQHRPQMATVRPRSTRPFERDPQRVGKIVRVGAPDDALLSRVEVLGYHRDERDAAAIEEAEVVVAGGRGMKRAAAFELLHALAEELGGMVGASRDAVDRGWISYPHQVGLSGKTISPAVYLAAGISGSIQHLAGIKTAESIIAINSDPEAAILKVADLAIVGDLFEVLPALTERLRALRLDTSTS